MTIPNIRPNDNSPPIMWAVHLGANTSKRLALEWGIKLSCARMRLQYACEMGLLRADRSCRPLRYYPRVRSPPPTPPTPPTPQRTPND